MALTTLEQRGGAGVIDADGRQTPGLATGAGKALLFTQINDAASGATLLVAADATRKIKVVSYVVVASAAVTVQFQSGGTALTGAMALAANGGLVASSLSASHLFETLVNNTLFLNLGGAVQVSGHLSYFLEA